MNDLMHGEGEFSYSGFKYVGIEYYLFLGDWNRCFMDGVGVFYYDGSRYEGRWRNGRREGNGVFVDP